MHVAPIGQFLKTQFSSLSWKSSLDQYSKLPMFNLLADWEKLEVQSEAKDRVQPKTNIQKSQFESMNELGKVMS